MYGSNPDPEVTPLPRNKHPEETIQKILDVSMKLFTEKGYEQTTVLDIVNNLGGLTRGAFYHHFKSKEEVLCALSERIFRNTLSQVSGRELENLNGLEKVRKLFLHNTVLAGSPGGDDYVKLQQASLSLLENPRFLAEQIRGTKEVATFFIPFIEEGMTDGSIRPGNPKLLAELLLVLFNLWMLPPLFPMDANEFEEKAMMIKACLDSLGFPLMNEEFLDAGETFAEILDIEE